MDLNAIKTAWEHYLLVVSGVAVVGYSIFFVGYVLVCAYRHMHVMAKRIGWASVAVLFTFCVWATITGTPTQEEKEEALGQAQGEAQTNAMFGAMLLGITGHVVSPHICQTNDTDGVDAGISIGENYIGWGDV